MTENSSYIFTKRRPNLYEKTKEKASHYSLKYVKSLFPIANWIGRYNTFWLYGDVIAGLTAGAVVIPQGMAYAKIVGLPPEYGLYSSFVGEAIYFIFATSKDITIGPTDIISLVLSQLMADILARPDHQFSAVQMASSFALFSGIFSLVLGMFRLGIIVDFIPGPVIAGFTTGSAITIAVNQIGKLMGIPNVKSTQASYLVLGKALAGLPKSSYDAGFGLVCLLFLYSLKFGTRYAAKRWPHRERLFFFIGILRNIAVVVIATLVSYLVNIGKTKSPISILKTIPSGFKVEAPVSSLEMFNTLGSSRLITVTVILILEHVALAKSFGRINDYKINSSQEFIAIGLTNVIGSFFHAYPATGSFSRTAIKSRSGVRTPLAGVFSGILVVIALFSTPVFYYIPDAALGALIIHAVLGLVSGPEYVKQLWKIAPLDLLIFVVGVVITFFVNVEWGIYASVLVAVIVILVKSARPRLDKLGQLVSKSREHQAYVAIDHPAFESVVTGPPDGILIFRFVNSLTYPNSNHLDDKIVEYVHKHTKKYFKRVGKGDFSWDENLDDAEEEEKSKKPRLRAVVFDMSAVNEIDSTGVHALFDIKKELNRYADRQVEYHFANLLNEHVEQSLIIAGFGAQPSTISVDFIGIEDDNEVISTKDGDEEITIGGRSDNTQTSKACFHFTLEDAIDAASSSPL